MKVLIVNEFYYPIQRGGAEVSTQILAENLVKLGNEVVVCCSADSDTVIEHNGVKIYNVKTNPFYWTAGNNVSVSRIKKLLWHLVDLCNLFVIPKFCKILKNEKPQIVHTSNLSHFSCLLWYILKKRNIPICHTIRDYYLLCHKCTMFKNGETCKKQCLSCKITSFPKKIFSQKVDSVVGISDFVLNIHCKNSYFPNAKRYVIYNATKPAYREKRNATKTIGFIGTLHKSKGIELLIKVFLQAETKGYVLKIAGTGADDYVQYLHSIAKEKSDSIIFLGKVNSVDFYKEVDLLIVPSLWEEPFGRTVVEAISSGIPVLASNRGGIPEILEKRREGFVVDIDNSFDFRYAIEQYVAGNLLFDFSNVEDFIMRYNELECAKKYIAVYKELLLK